jgi:Flp pilus assembly protein TadD
MATALRDSEDFDSAEHAYRKAISLKPDYLEAYNNLSVMLLYLDRTDEALRVLADAMKVDEKNVSTLINIARVQLKRNSHQVAEQAIRLAISVEPDKADAYGILAQIQHDMDRHGEALASIDKALELSPDSAEHHSFKGVLLKSVGRLPEAHAEIRKALEISPDFYAAYTNLNDLEDFEAGSELLGKMKEILQTAENPHTDRYVPIYFTLAKALEDVSEYEEALKNYEIGARLHRAHLKYDEADTKKFFDSIKETFTREVFANRRWPGHPSRTPVFIVGMPRSGSTLTEQILSSHPQVYGAGEVKVLNRVLGVLRDRLPSIPKFPSMALALEPVHFQEIANGYLVDVQKDAGGAERVTDKLLTNFFFLGLINLVFPNAKVIHTRRNPVDTCLSTYTKLFKDDMPHSYDFGELGRYYLFYEDLMRHWEAVLPPGFMMTVDYESVIDDLETSARALVSHVGLEWDEACIDFHKSKRAVKTASVVQVRKPMYKTSVERFRRYGDGLKPLLEALNYPRPA